MIEHMTHDEIIKRLNTGEDPIDLAIEKYDRLIEIAQDGGKIDMNWIYSHRCPLCLVYNCRDDDDYDDTVITTCPLEKIGEWCMDDDSAWQ